MSDERVCNLLEAALLAAGRPLTLEELTGLFAEEPAPGVDRRAVRAALDELAGLWSARALELVEVAGGFRLQVRKEYAATLGRLWAERAPKFSRAFMETLAIIAYRQPVTRGEIEELRGVALSSSILRTMHERQWLRVLGHKEVPGRPELLGTTRQFLDDFGLRDLAALPPLGELRDLDRLHDDLFAETLAPAPAAEYSVGGTGGQTETGERDGHSGAANTPVAPGAAEEGA